MDKFTDKHGKRFFDLRFTKGRGEMRFVNGESNLITPDVLWELDSILNEMSWRDDTNCIVLRSGLNGIFSRGLDVKFMKSLDETEKDALLELSRTILSRLERTEVPVIGVIAGDCFGAGLEIALSCDIRIASRTAAFSAPEIIFELVPTRDGINRLLRLVGRGNASKMVLSGKKINADEALRIGLVDDLAEDSDVYETAEKLASRFSRIKRTSLIKTKKYILNEDSRTEMFVKHEESSRTNPITVKERVKA